MKRTILLIMVFLLAFTNIIVCAQTDISEWAKPEVSQAVKMGFVPNELQTDYTDNITRAEFAKMAVSYLAFMYQTDNYGMVKIYCDTKTLNEQKLILEEELALAEKAFTDCDELDVYYAYIMRIVKGKGDGIFDPNGLITREEAATMLMRTLFVYGGGLKHGPEIEEFEKYSDYDTISDWALSDVQYVWKLNIMKGVSETEFSPKTNYTKEQSVVTFLRLYNNYWIRPIVS